MTLKIGTILSIPGNDSCVDCGYEVVEYVNVPLGVFLCPLCAHTHKFIEWPFKDVRPLFSTQWEQNELEALSKQGNTNSKAVFEKFLPNYVRRPEPNNPVPTVLRELFVRAKYERHEFTDAGRQTGFTAVSKRGPLLKRSRRENKFVPRIFALSLLDRTISYYLKDDPKEQPKAVLSLEGLNVTLPGEKVGHRFGMQLTWLHTEEDTASGSTRNVYLYATSAKDCFDWYHAIRHSKLYWLTVAFPMSPESELVGKLMHDFSIEGWILKAGPRERDAWKRRWFTLDRRTLMYFADPLDPFPKGEIFIGHEQEGYGVHVGVARSPTRSGSKADISSLDAGASLVLTPVEDRHSSESLSANYDRRPSTTDLQMSKSLRGVTACDGGGGGSGSLKHSSSGDLLAQGQAQGLASCESLPGSGGGKRRSSSIGNWSAERCGFTLRTPDRDFLLIAPCLAERDRWLPALAAVCSTPTSPQDHKRTPRTEYEYN